MSANQKEIWKPVIGFEGLYEISSKKRIRNSSGRIRKVNHNFLFLFKNKQAFSISVLRMYKMVFENTEVIIDKTDRITLNNEGQIIVRSHRKLTAEGKKRSVNKKCRLTGVSVSTSKGKPFNSQIHIKGKTIHLGAFDTEEEANIMYRKAVKYIEFYKDHSKTFRNILHSLNL